MGAAFDPLAPEMAVDPYPHYRRLRERDPVHRSALGFWFLTRHADVAAFFAERRLAHCYPATQAMRLGPDVVNEPYFRFFRLMVFVLDNPDHRRIRNLFRATFTPRRVNELRPRVQAIADELVDRVEPQRRMDLVHDFALPFPNRVIGELLGVPFDDFEMTYAWTMALNPVLEFLPMDATTLARANTAVLEIADYFRALAVKRRAEPRDDLFSAMVHAADEGESFTEDELVANAILLYLAGFETTAGSTGLAVLNLHRNRDQLALLQADAGLLPKAARELLRHDSPGQATARVAMEPVEFGGVRIDAGQGIVAWIGAANRDPAAYPDPDRLDLRREPAADLLSFGGGAHYCLGHALAVQELEVALGTLLRRCPKLELETLEPAFRPTSLMRGIQALPVRW